MKERSKVVINLDGAPPAPYREWIAQRNGRAGQLLARYLAVPYEANPTLDDFADPLSYIIPATAIDREKASNAFGVQTETDFYGAAFAELSHTNKSMLYPCISFNPPAFYSGDLARQLQTQGLTLPGYTGFAKEAIINAYSLCANDSYNMRVIAPNSSDGNGQFSVETEKDLRKILATFDDEVVAREGLVVVADLDRPETISVGSLRIGDETFHFFAEQKNIRGIKGSVDGQTTFGGSYLTVARSFEELKEHADSTTKYVLEKSRDFLQIYRSHVDPLASRLSVDMVFGAPNKTKNGQRINQTSDEVLLGGTDITPRFGGHCPALALALQEFKRHPDLQIVRGEVTLNYDPNQGLVSEQGATHFIDNQELRLTARINEVVRGGTVFPGRM